MYVRSRQQGIAFVPILAWVVVAAIIVGMFFGFIDMSELMMKLVENVIQESGVDTNVDFSGITGWMLWWTHKIRLWDGLTVITAAYVARFAIRRIPVVG